MRVFKNYSPVRIARYVVLFFKGSFEIQGHGQFMFDGGKVVIGSEEKVNACRLKICREINNAIYTMTCHLRSQSFQLSKKVHCTKLKITS